MSVNEISILELLQCPHDLQVRWSYMYFVSLPKFFTASLTILSNFYAENLPLIRAPFWKNATPHRVFIIDNTVLSNWISRVSDAIWIEFAYFLSYHLSCYPSPNPTFDHNPNPNSNSNSNPNPKPGKLFHKMCKLYLFSILFNFVKVSLYNVYNRVH